MKPIPFPKTIQHDLLRALQCAYYAYGLSLVDDYTFDMMEQAYEDATGLELPIGSDSAESYPKAIRYLMTYLQETLKP